MQEIAVNRQRYKKNQITKNKLAERHLAGKQESFFFSE